MHFPPFLHGLILPLFFSVFSPNKMQWFYHYFDVVGINYIYKNCKFLFSKKKVLFTHSSKQVSKKLILELISLKINLKLIEKPIPRSL
jgi:hypothetical protein